jgi:hypothetical protein
LASAAAALQSLLDVLTSRTVSSKAIARALPDVSRALDVVDRATTVLFAAFELAPPDLTASVGSLRTALASYREDLRARERLEFERRVQAARSEVEGALVVASLACRVGSDGRTPVDVVQLLHTTSESKGRGVVVALDPELIRGPIVMDPVVVLALLDVALSTLLEAGLNKPYVEYGVFGDARSCLRIRASTPADLLGGNAKFRIHRWSRSAFALAQKACERAGLTLTIDGARSVAVIDLAEALAPSSASR